MARVAGGRVPLLTVDHHVDIFHVRRGDVVAGLAFVTAGLVSHDACNVQVLLPIQRLGCRDRGDGGDGGRQGEGSRERKEGRKETELNASHFYSVFPQTRTTL